MTVDKGKGRNGESERGINGGSRSCFHGSPRGSLHVVLLTTPVRTIEFASENLCESVELSTMLSDHQTTMLSTVLIDGIVASGFHYYNVHSYRYRVSGHSPTDRLSTIPDLASIQQLHNENPIFTK